MIFINIVFKRIVANPSCTWMQFSQEAAAVERCNPADSNAIGRAAFSAGKNQWPYVLQSGNAIVEE
jgi:hypothetical protein